jgi:hypothetical protein
LSETNEDPWTVVPIFYWGDTDGANNGTILPYHFPPEADNAGIPASELYNGGLPYPTGIIVPIGGIYRYIRIGAPAGCQDSAQIDSIEIWTPTPIP